MSHNYKFLSVVKELINLSLTVILGSTEEIPAESCKEINLNENGKAPSGIYWLNLKRSDKIAQVYCDMQTEGETF